MKVKRAKRVRGEIIPPADKSITHRMILFSALTRGKSRVYNPLKCDDTKRSVELIKAVGAKVEESDDCLIVSASSELSEPLSPIYCGNSGTTARIGMGLLARENFFSVLYGDDSLSRRPMRRVVDPLKNLGVRFDGRNNSSNLPMCMRGGSLHACEYRSEISSAQVKSAFIMAALSADGDSTYVEEIQSRDHTERFLSKYALVSCSKGRIEVHPGEIPPFDVNVVGDFSSAAFFLTLACIHPNARLKLINVGLNPTRTGLLKVLERMGAHVEIRFKDSEFEPVGDLVVESSQLMSTEVEEKEIPALIDEVPLVALLGAFAQGETVVRGAQELRKKESDRIASTVEILKSMGVDIEELPDGFKVKGNGNLHSASVDSVGDHRMAMLASVAATCVADVDVKGAESVSISYPKFFFDLEKVTKW